MNKKELAILLVIPIFAFLVASFGVYTSIGMLENTSKGASLIEESNDLIDKLEASTPHEIQDNIKNYASKIKSLLVGLLNDEQEDINLLYTYFYESLIVFTIWILLVIVIFITSRRRLSKIASNQLLNSTPKNGGILTQPLRL